MTCQTDRDTFASRPSRINAALARRIVAAGAEREAAHREAFTLEGFNRWVTHAKRGTMLRTALAFELANKPFHNDHGTAAETIFLSPPACGWRPRLNPA